MPIGANTLGLYYNEDILKKAGVDPSTVTDWATLNAALEKVTKAGNKGITFSGVAGEEGTFQFLPWFWGAGANLKDLGSAQAVQAGQLVSDWVAKGYAPEVGHHRQPDGLVGPVPHRRRTPSPRTAPGSPRPPPRRSSRSR